MQPSEVPEPVQPGLATPHLSSVSTVRPQATPRHENKDLSELVPRAGGPRPALGSQSERSPASVASPHSPRDNPDSVERQVTRELDDGVKSAADWLDQLLTPNRSTPDVDASSLRKLVADDIQIKQKGRHEIVGGPGRRRVEFRTMAKSPRPESLQKALEQQQLQLLTKLGIGSTNAL